MQLSVGSTHPGYETSSPPGWRGNLESKQSKPKTFICYLLLESWVVDIMQKKRVFVPCESLCSKMFQILPSQIPWISSKLEGVFPRRTLNAFLFEAMHQLAWEKCVFFKQPLILKKWRCKDQNTWKVMKSVEVYIWALYILQSWKKNIYIYIYICIIHTYTTQHVLHPLSNRNALQAVMLRWQLSALRFTSPQRGGEKKNTPEVETRDLMLCVYIYSTTYQKHRFEDIINEKGQPLVWFAYVKLLLFFMVSEQSMSAGDHLSTWCKTWYGL